MSLKDKRLKIALGVGAVVVIAGLAIVATVTGTKQAQIAQQNNQRAANPVTPADLVDTDYAYIVQDSTGTNVPVPKGYVASPITTGFTNVAGLTISDGGENTINTGFVIYEKLANETDQQARTAISNDPWEAQKTRNQWVWVPVPDPSTIYGTDSNGKKWGKLYNFDANNTDNITGTTANNWTEANGVMSITSAASYREPDVVTGSGYDEASKLKTYNLVATTTHDFLMQLEKEFEQSIASIEKYGGFYIGRYETGGLDASAKVVKMDEQISNQTWYTMYAKSKKIRGDNPNITTSMIFGSQQDRTLMWLIESGNKTKAQIASDSDWGNYNNRTFTYTNASGTSSTKNTNSSTRIPSGSSEYTRANNIYDLAGNVCDWRN